MHLIFQISISRNTTCAHKVGFRKSSNIYLLYGPRFFHSDASDSADILQAPGYLSVSQCHPRVHMKTRNYLGQEDRL